MSKVITYQTSRGNKISLTPEQVAKLEAAHVWPKDALGEDYSGIYMGLHYGSKSLTDDQIAQLCASKCSDPIEEDPCAT